MTTMKKILFILAGSVLTIVTTAQEHIQFDLAKVPFSTRGSYFAFSQLKEREVTDQLFLHHFIGLDTRTLFSFSPVDKNGESLPYTLTATPVSVVMKTDDGTIMICFENDRIIRIKASGNGIRLQTDAFRLPMYLSTDQFRLPGYNRYDRLMVTKLSGNWQIVLNSEIDQSKYDLHSQTHEPGVREIILIPGSTGESEMVLEEYVSEWEPKSYNKTFEQCLQNSNEKYMIFLDKAPDVPEEYRKAHELALYINWSALVRSRGVMKREGMLMSKNWMNYIWSWDNCFNAMAMAYGWPDISWNQIMVEFENQDELGILPDRFRDVFIHFGFTKPPVYGIAINRLAKAGMMNREKYEEVYPHLVKLTDFWFKYRDDDRDGFPQYHHGNDSGWDNGTVFDVGYPVEGPDLSAFLVLQMEALSDIAFGLGKADEALVWKNRAEELSKKIVDEFWIDGKFVYKHYPDGAYNEKGQSLLSYIPIILGERLPGKIQIEIITQLKESGIVTEFGPATEHPGSPDYTADGYWRGPIWAPSTFMIVEGLNRCGEKDFARDIAARFCNMCRDNGFGENFNALTGEPLRDPAYTWTSSVFLYFLYKYL